MFLEQPGHLPPRAYTVRSSSGHVIAHSTELALSRAERRRGLLGRDHLPPDHALLIFPCSSIHTFFMQFPIDVIFVRRNGDVLKTVIALPAWRLASKWGAAAVIELPAGAIARAGVKVGDRLELL